MGDAPAEKVVNAAITAGHNSPVVSGQGNVVGTAPDPNLAAIHAMDIPDSQKAELLRGYFDSKK